jgi:hypothetical protein
MSAERAFGEFAAAWERGEQPDPATTLASVDEADREPLAAMLAAYLAANPREVTEDEVLARAADPRSDPPRAWPELLPALRARTGTTRGALVARLAEALGHPDARAQVEEHVHELETGQLPAARVRPPVVAALARILQVPEALLEMGRAIAPPPADASQAPLALYRQAPPAAPLPEVAEEAREAKEARNAEIDDLFTGGG